MHTRFRLFLTACILTVCAAAVAIPPSAVQATAYDAPGRNFDASISGVVDIGFDIVPATSRKAGYVFLWYYPHDADDIAEVLTIPGAPVQRRLTIPLHRTT